MRSLIDCLGAVVEAVVAARGFSTVVEAGAEGDEVRVGSSSGVGEGEMTAGGKVTEAARRIAPGLGDIGGVSTYNKV